MCKLLLVAKLKTTAEAYNRESSLKELRTFLDTIFSPALKDCYQEVLELPPVDEIHIKPERVTLVIAEPYLGSGLHPDLRKFYDDLDYKNRILFLSGARDTLETLLETAAELKAITYILGEIEAEKVAENDPQRTAAVGMCDTITLRLLSAARETFTTLVFPHGDQLMSADFLMQFTDNHYNGERQIRDTLKAKQKFTEDIASDTFQKKCEQRLFTQKVMPWSEIKKRAAMNTRWQWHRMDALDTLKDTLAHKDQWRENGSYIEKPPFPQPQIDVRIQELTRNDDTGAVTLRLTPVYGDIIHYEVGAQATSASAKVQDPKHFETSELEVSFLCVDTKGEHETGTPITWQNRLTIKSRTFQSGHDKIVELRATPEVPLRYTSDGSDPKISGARYHDPFVIPQGTHVVLAVAEKNGLVSDIHRLDIDWQGHDAFKIDPDQPVTWKREHTLSTTKESYEFLDRLRKYQAVIPGPRVSIVGQPHWLELTCDNGLRLDAANLEAIIDHLRGLLSEGQVTVEAPIVMFPTGQHLLDWVEEVHTAIHPHEVSQ